MLAGSYTCYKEQFEAEQSNSFSFSTRALSHDLAGFLDCLQGEAILSHTGGVVKMLKSRVLRWFVPLVVIAAGVTVVAVFGSVGPFNRPNVPAPPPGEVPSIPLSAVNPATAADEAKGIYSGPLGDFLVTPSETSAAPSCPEPRKFRTQHLKTSELYSPLFGDNPEVVECGDGKIIMIGLIGGPAMGRQYFVGQAKVPYEGPFDRLVLLTVGGYSAVAQLPHPAFPSSLHLAVIQRFPSSHEPGILVWIDNARSLKEASARAAQIMGVQP
jgi:hypothetical protein